MSRPLAEHDGRCSPLLWSGRRRERRGAKKRSLPCLGCRTERGVLRMRRTVPPCDEKFSPLCLKCRTRGRRRGVWRSGGRIFREQGCPCVLPGGRHSCFPRSRARLRHSIRFFHQEVGPDHSAPQAARAAPWRSVELRGNPEEPGNPRRSEAPAPRQGSAPGAFLERRRELLTLWA